MPWSSQDPQWRLSARHTSGLHSRGLLIVLTASALLVALYAERSAAQIAVGTFDGFQDGTTQGWVASLGFGIPPVPPAAIANAGPTGAGDFALRLTATGSPNGAGGKLVVNNVDSRWTGDYAAAGVDAIMVDVNNPNAFPLTIRVGISESPSVSPSGLWVTQGAVVPASSGWVTLSLSLSPDDLLPADGLALDANVTLANVGVIRLLHTEAVNYRGEAIAALLDVDNVEAVPEPSLWLGLLAGGLLLRSMGAERRRP